MLSNKRSETIKDRHSKPGLDPTKITHCVCMKCGAKVPYTLRRCIALEDCNGKVEFCGKSFRLINLCVECLRESGGRPEIGVLLGQELME